MRRLARPGDPASRRAAELRCGLNCGAPGTRVRRHASTRADSSRTHSRCRAHARARMHAHTDADTQGGAHIHTHARKRTHAREPTPHTQTPTHPPAHASTHTFTAPGLQRPRTRGRIAFLLQRTCAQPNRVDILAAWSTALTSGASPQGRGLEPHRCHLEKQRARVESLPAFKHAANAARRTHTAVFMNVWASGRVCADVRVGVGVACCARLGGNLRCVGRRAAATHRRAGHARTRRGRRVGV